jgi:hypothetical protein
MFVHPPAVRQAVHAQIALGVNDCAISRRLGIPRETVRDMRWALARPDTRPRCPRCWRPTTAVALGAADYAELLGLYLGDGHITEMPRTEKLRLSLDARYPGIVADSEALLRRGFPENRVNRVRADRGATVVLYVHHGHLSCLFPQHGPGKKHLRRILLEPWQRELVAQAPWPLVRGFIRSDGCAFINRTGRYEYLSYQFANLSDDILDLFTRTCESLGLRPRRTARSVRLNRREDVARLVEQIGLKA